MIGQTISHYRILEKLGEGGMGVVYKAEDLKLERTVALKFLPLELTRDRDAKTRFVHEAKAASALQHHNICTIHEIDETEDGRVFISMDCYEGETLKDKIAKGPLAVDKAIDIVSQVAEGLAKAHEMGMVHRDIKPANIMVTSDGMVKILDFGLAKLAGQTKITKTGTTVGTVAYMSPEQASGKDIDHRSDIFSLGVVLYELLTGELPFKGDHEAAVLYGIMHNDPKPLLECKDHVPDGLQRVVNKALAKDTETRYQNMEDLLKDLKQERSSDWELVKAIDARPRGPGSISKLVALAILAIIIVVVLLDIFGKQPTDRVPAKHRRVTFNGSAFAPAISPDGKFMAWWGYDSENDGKVMVQDLAGGRALEVLSGVRSVSSLRWSPDGSELLFTGGAGGSFTTYLIPRLGGSTRPIEVPFIGVACWSPDGGTIAGTWTGAKSIWFADKTTADTTSIPLRKEFDWILGIDWSPVGDRLLFRTTGGDDINTIWTIKTDGTHQQNVVTDSIALWSPRWSARGGAIYYFRTDLQTVDLMKVKVTSATGKAIESPRILQTGINATGCFSMSKDNKKLLCSRGLYYSNLWLAAVEGEGKAQSTQKKQLTTGRSVISEPSISPDDRRVALSVGSHGRINVFVMSIDGGEMQQLTFFNSQNGGACWSSDGGEIAFGSEEDGKARVWKVASNGGTPRPFESSELSAFSLDWAPGSNILYHRPGNRNFHLLNPKTGEERPLVANDSVGWMFGATTSPDDKNVAVAWNRTDGAEIGVWLISLEDSSQSLLYGAWATPIRWSADGKWIFADKQDAETRTRQIIMIPTAGGEPKTLLTLPSEDASGIGINSDGSRIVYDLTEYEFDVWVMENFDPEVE